MSKKLLRIITGIAGMIFFILSSVILGIDLVQYKQQTLIYPPGSSINGVPLGGLIRSTAKERLESVFTLPVELRYDAARMQFSPLDLGFVPNFEKSLELLESRIKNKGYWAHLWNNNTQNIGEIPLEVEIDETKMQSLLAKQIITRYDQKATASIPIVETTNFQPGSPGTALDSSSAIPLLKKSLLSSTDRIVELPIQRSEPQVLDIQNLETFLIQAIQNENYDGLVEIYINDLAGSQDLHFAVNNFELVTPDIAFSAASLIKIPIMVSTFIHSNEPMPDEVQTLLKLMIEFSENPPADTLMSNVIDINRGPLVITEEMQTLGYENTFLAGYFYFGAPVLELFKTPANTRTDIFLDPDIYNQTVPSEIGDLLSQIYTCAHPEKGDSRLLTQFDGQITQGECQQMLDLLATNKIGFLIEGGLPPDATIAHKHGWTSELDGLLHSMSDAGVVYSPGGDFVLTIFIYSPEQLVFYEGNWLFAKLSQTIYNAFNLNNQAYWWIE
ncbi:MAG: class A beta-lactamase-related serine hydrolase [Anaerolineaceae bacterium]|nr:class A beta-lactamase-related serine hydrolase [Anaerolineaceae bacterium]